ncbi:inner membrane protein YhjD [Nakamurella silvestris]|nr:inner membrane protein YhjD [Nakamurella silvestris]
MSQGPSVSMTKSPGAPDKGPDSALVATVKKIAARKGIAHLIRAGTRYVSRLGAQFAGAITYFSFLSLVPLLMLAFSIAGFVLANNPSLIDKLKDSIADFITDPSLLNSINNLVDSAISQRFGVGIVALLIALYSGIGWMGNLKDAIGAQWRPRFEVSEKETENYFLGLAKNLLALAGFGVGILVSVALTTVASAANDLVKDLLGLQYARWIDPVLAVTPIVVAIVADTVIFYWLYRILPRPRDMVPRKAVFRGAVFAAFGFEILKFAITIIIPMTSRSPASSVFGPIIGLLLFINLVSQLILFVAAWIATADLKALEAAEAQNPKNAVPVVIRPQYRVAAGSRLATVALGIGALGGWVAGRFGRRK